MRIIAPAPLLFSVILLIAVVAPVHGQSVKVPITPVPCPNQATAFADPSFEPLLSATSFFGKYAGGVYRIEIPDQWNGELLLWAHGSRPAAGEVFVSLPGTSTAGSQKWREHLIQRGFAWAASSFRCNGDAGIGLVDTVALLDVFSQVTSGQKPSRIYLAGGSMGGITTWLGLRYMSGVFAGGLAMCPAVSTDFFIAVREAAGLIAGIDFNTLKPDEIVRRAGAVFGEPSRLTEKGRQLASIQVHLSGGPRPFAWQGLVPRLLQNIAGIPKDLHMRSGTNVGVTYNIDETLGLRAVDLNNRVRRRAPDLGLIGQYAELGGFDGRIEQPLLTMHGTGDMQVPIAVERDIRKAVAAQSREHLLVQRIMRIPGHCGFNDTEQIRAFDDLVTWVRQGVQPEGDDVFQDLRNAGLKFTDPLRLGDPGTADVSSLK